MRIITIARKPLSESTVAQNVLKHGCGGLNIDECRVSTNEDLSDLKPFGTMPSHKTEGKGWSRPWMANKKSVVEKQVAAIEKMKSMGRWPANLILIHKAGCERVEDWNCEEGCPAPHLDNQSGISTSAGGRIGNKDGGGIYGGGVGLRGSYAAGDPGFGDVGGASRFFKQFKEDE